MNSSKTIKFGTGTEGVAVTISRRGLEIYGWYDDIVGIEGGTIPWEIIDKLRPKGRRQEFKKEE